MHTQISGNIRSNNQAYMSLIQMLTELGVLTTHSLQENGSTYQAIRNIWQRYDDEVAFYQSIAHSSFHIIYNDAEIDNSIGMQILYALLKNRPIIMTGAPFFSQDLHPIISELIINHLHDLHSIELPELDLIELQELFNKLRGTNYNLTKSEKILIKSLIRSHFRDILKL